MRLKPELIDQLLHPTLDPKAKKQVIAKAASQLPPVQRQGRWSSAQTRQAVRRAKDGEKVLLVRIETSPDDIHGLGTRQRVSCRPALRGFGGAVQEGQILTIDGVTGEVILGEVPTVPPQLPGAFGIIMAWAGVRAQGIGLARHETEHMFFADRKVALEELLTMQREDITGAVPIMDGRPVTVRLLDPWPRPPAVPLNRVRRRATELQEANPMLGHRGCRLAITYPEICEMQARAIFEAAAAVGRAGGAVPVAEVMVPLVATLQELSILKEVVEKTAAAVQKEQGMNFTYRVGTMIELPRACLQAGKLAEQAEFFSFGTNDLTQTTYGMSRDDAGAFLPEYKAKGIVEQDPFVSLDQEGVGELIKVAVEVGLDSLSCSPFRVPLARLATGAAAALGCGVRKALQPSTRMTKNPADAAAAAMARRAKGGNKKSTREVKKYFVYGAGVLVTIVAVWLAATDGQAAGKKKSREYRSKATAQVNDRYFLSDVTSYAAGNFTAAAGSFFNGWTYADVSYGLDGVAVRGEGMIGFAGALQRCQDETDDLEGGAVPPAYDLRDQKPGCESGEVYSQGNCSSSYAIAAATALSSRFCFSDPEAYAQTRLSPQQIVSCDKKSQGCNGGGIDSVWSYIERRGLFPESCVPFAGATKAECKSDCDPEKKLKAMDHCILGGEKKIKREVYNRGPVVAPVLLKDDFLVYKGGVYTPTDYANQQYGPNGEPLVHAVTIIGWGRSEGTPYWLVKNSWGKDWGEDGYARITMGTGVLREESIIVGYAATPEALEAAAKKKEAEEQRKEELKKERAERDARIREREAQRAAEAAERASQEEDTEDLDFEDDEEVDVDSQEAEGDDP
ncbi:unnamed protein product [Effrenium voratum]|uniref:Peptidase C1A papain C-terminal domain-containing protein n=1 Tax=Effrenium voratum TaxID=2562239 RepID=A0AA36IX48_9DINO|nr:unnamed protein product [Effrenium voratum]